VIREESNARRPERASMSSAAPDRCGTSAGSRPVAVRLSCWIGS
jgi:hypothetical protein